MEKYRAIIIGSGIGGMAMAIRLRNAGWEVIVLEKNITYGGKLGEISSQGFRFDTGPSLLTLPGLLDELIQSSGKNPRDYINYKRLSIATKYFFPDKTIINAFSEPEKFARELSEKTGENPDIILSFLIEQAENFRALSPVFLEQSIHRIKNYFNLSVFKALLRVPELHPFKTMNEQLENVFTSQKTISIFGRYATYNGSSPFKAPALLNLIAHPENNEGAYVAEGGMFSIATGLYNLARDLGVSFFFNSPALQIETEQKIVKGVRTKEIYFSTKVAISNVDVETTYSRLLPSINPPKKYLDREKSTSALIFYWGVKGTFPDLDIHNIIFSGDYKKEFDFLFQKKEIFEDPTIYIYISKKFNPSDAPEDCENWFVMINCPYFGAQDNEKVLQRIKPIIIKKIENQLNIKDLEDRIIQENIRTPTDLEFITGAEKGALYGSSSNSRLAAFYRHPNFSPVKGLYFCGGTVHPGGGIPLCLQSAKITTREILSNND